MQNSKQFVRPVRVLHVVGGMDCGGIESWLMHVLRHSDGNLVRHDFLYTLSKNPCYFDSEMNRLGSRFFHLSCHHRNLLKLRNAYYKVMVENGPYDVIHSHTGWYSGIVMQYAAKFGVPMRIAHTHNVIHSSVQVRESILRRIYIKRMHHFITHHATHGIACGEDAGKAYWGDSWGKDSRWKVLCCGVDLTPFSESVDRGQVRRDLGIPDEAFVVGHIGRFETEKNHEFIIDIMEELVQIEANSVLLLVGTGSLQPAIEAKVHRLGLKDKVIFTGVRADVPQLIKAMNGFLLPSLYEGMGLVGIEAQAAGVPCVVNEQIPLAVEGNIVPGLIHALSLSTSPKEWAKRIHELRYYDPCRSPQDALHRVMQSPFNIKHSVDALTDLYLCAFDQSLTCSDNILLSRSAEEIDANVSNHSRDRVLHRRA